MGLPPWCPAPCPQRSWSHAPASSRCCVLCGSGPVTSPSSLVPVFPAPPRATLPLSVPDARRLSPCPAVRCPKRAEARRPWPRTVRGCACRRFHFFKIPASCQYLKIKTCTRHLSSLQASGGWRPQACISPRWGSGRVRFCPRPSQAPASFAHPLLCLTSLRFEFVISAQEQSLEVSSPPTWQP